MREGRGGGAAVTASTLAPSTGQTAVVDRFCSEESEFS